MHAENAVKVVAVLAGGAIWRVAPALATLQLLHTIKHNDEARHARTVGHPIKSAAARPAAAAERQPAGTEVDRADVRRQAGAACIGSPSTEIQGHRSKGSQGLEQRARSDQTREGLNWNPVSSLARGRLQQAQQSRVRTRDGGAHLCRGTYEVQLGLQGCLGGF